MGLRCLIVDDNASFLAAARSVLEREGVAVVGLASSSAEALQRAQELHPDVVLVDILLGEESGFALAHRLAGGDSDGSKVILISTHAEVDFETLIDETPAVGFVPKSELSASAIRRLVEAAPPSAP